MKEIRVLHYIPGFQYGGIESLIINLYKNIDRKKVQFDFISEDIIPEDTAKEILAMGGKIYQISKVTKKDIINHIKQIYAILKDNDYSILHSHSIETRPFILIIAKILGIKRRIIHSHEAAFNSNNHILLRKIMKKITVIFSNEYMACSKDALTFLIGKKATKKGYVLRNAIDIESFKFNDTNRQKIRKLYNINENEILIGNVGRFAYLKNQTFIIDVLNEIYKINKQVKLMLVGDGKSKAQLIEKTNKYGISDNVVFAGKQNNVNEYISAFDLFLFPSIKEGLGISLIEAQANKVNCIISDGIPKEAYVLDNIITISLNEDCKKWANIIIKNLQINYDRILNEKENDKISEYDIKGITKKYEQYILESGK